MPIRTLAHFAFVAVCALCVALGFAAAVLAQGSEIDKLAARTAEQLVKANPTVLLLAPDESCNLALSICETLDSAVRTALQQTIPQVKIVGREESVTDLKQNGFYAIDAYSRIALRLVGLSESAEAMVIEGLSWQKDGYVLGMDIWNVKTNERLVPFHTLELRVQRPGPDTSDNPMLVTDPDTNASVVVFKGPLPKHFVYPGCEKSPDPHSIGRTGVVTLIGTITAQGKIENVSVVSSPTPAFTKAALDTLQTWRFRPAVGVDGKAFAFRAPIEVNFAR